MNESFKRVFEEDKFKALGKGEDFTFQALAFVGNASKYLALASTVLERSELPDEIETELKLIQQRLQNFTDKLRGKV